MTGLPLEGIRVLDLGWVIAGPLSTRFLAVMGAEVIKVGTARRTEFQDRTYNQSKLSCALNLSRPEGIVLAKKLISVSDILVENMAAGAIERLGLGYDVVSEVRSDIIMVSCSGLGQTGPDSDLVAYGSLLQDYTGWNSTTGGGGLMADPWVGMELAMVTLAALNHRAGTGVGQHIDYSMAEALVGTMSESILDYQMNDRRVKPPLGNRDEWHAPHGAYRCNGEDRWVAIAVTSDEQWPALCRVIGREDLADDPELADASGRRRRAGELDAAIVAWTAQYDDYEAMRLLQEGGVPAGASLDIQRLFEDRQLVDGGYLSNRARGESEHGYEPGVPWRTDRWPEPRLEPAPTLGQHNAYVYRELLGLSPEEISRLAEDEVIY